MSKQSSTLAWLAWGALAIAAGSAGMGRFLFLPAVWLAPAVLVKFVRSAPGRWALPGLVVVQVVVFEIAFQGTVPLPPAARIGLMTGMALVLGLIFLMDRWWARRSDSFLTTLVLPCGWAAYDLIGGLFSPNGTWGSLGYSLTYQTPVAQLASVTGWTGLTFLLAWSGTVLNWLWESRARRRPVLQGLVLAAAVFTGVLGFGYYRLLSAETGPVSRVALLSSPDTFRGEHLEEVWAYTRGVEISDEQLDQARGQIASWQDRQFALLDRALAGGARLAVWAEVNAAFTPAEEAAWIDRARDAARGASAYVGLGLAVFRPETRQPTQNRFVLIGPEGETVWDYSKATRVPGSHHEVGDGRLPQADTELGKLSGAICFDMDFPRLLLQAGRMGTDVLIAPSNDWTEVREIHARMAVQRAIEQGFTLVRPTKDGLSVVSDALGRVLARLDTDNQEDNLLLVNVPTRGLRTVYSRVGDLFGYLACAGFAASLILAVRRRQGGAGRRN